MLATCQAVALLHGREVATHRSVSALQRCDHALPLIVPVPSVRANALLLPGAAVRFQHDAGRFLTRRSAPGCPQVAALLLLPWPAPVQPRRDVWQVPRSSFAARALRLRFADASLQPGAQLLLS